MDMWSPWHGCRKISAGCQNCYVYARDASVGKDASIISRTKSFDLPLKRKRDGSFTIPSGSRLFTCGTTDFFLQEADDWRKEAWRIMYLRPDVVFTIVTKRPHRFYESLPKDYGPGYSHIHFYCTVEDQSAAESRLPLFLNLPIPYKGINCEPLLGPVDLTPALKNGGIRKVSVGGESGPHGRPLHYEWVVDVKRQCDACFTPFHFKQTGTHFKKDGKCYTIPRKLQMLQAQKAGLDT
ncbi:MAG: DUF5131 family protein [Clostridiales bacterium]|nr:DUF5131 family protein [Clostridiales bacterium]